MCAPSSSDQRIRRASTGATRYGRPMGRTSRYGEWCDSDCSTGDRSPSIGNTVQTYVVRRDGSGDHIAAEPSRRPMAGARELVERRHPSARHWRLRPAAPSRRTPAVASPSTGAASSVEDPVPWRHGHRRNRRHGNGRPTTRRSSERPRRYRGPPSDASVAGPLGSDDGSFPTGTVDRWRGSVLATPRTLKRPPGGRYLAAGLAS